MKNEFHQEGSAERTHNSAQDGLSIEPDLQGLLRDSVDGELSTHQYEVLSKLLREDPSWRRRYIDHLLLDAELTNEFSSESITGMIDAISDQQAVTDPTLTVKLTSSRPQLSLLRLTWLAIAATLFVAGLFAGVIIDRLEKLTMPSSIITENAASHSSDPSWNASQSVIHSVDGSAAIVNAASARFYNERTPPINSLLLNRREYVLTSGTIELRFPLNILAVIESPAVFRVLSDSELALDVGRCSMHSSRDADGFRIETQMHTVVDRGSKFTVSVTESAQTEIHVIEGNVDVYRRHRSGEANGREKLSDAVTQLSGRKAIALTDDPLQITEVDFDGQKYMDQLPDRVVSYGTKKNSSGDSEWLQEVTVQRNGKLSTYSADELIHCAPISFRAVDKVDTNGHLALNNDAKVVVQSLFQDDSLLTGIINPGGQTKLLDGTPVLEGSSNENQIPWMGLGIRFNKPVINREGPDIVLFELQTLTNPHDGDSFHVYPFDGGDTLYGHTVRKFDISMNSSEAVPLAGFQLEKYSQAVRSIHDLTMLPHISHRMRLNFHALATGIDLSDLGYAIGESTDRLFIQDAGDENSKIDPVFIGGLP